MLTSVQCVTANLRSSLISTLFATWTWLKKRKNWEYNLLYPPKRLTLRREWVFSTLYVGLINRFCFLIRIGLNQKLVYMLFFGLSKPMCKHPLGHQTQCKHHLGWRKGFDFVMGLLGLKVGEDFEAQR